MNIKKTYSNTHHSQAGCRIHVIQNGARHDYSIPLALHRKGALVAVYTDLISSSKTGSLLKWLAPVGSNLEKVLKRRTPPPELLPQFTDFGIVYLVKRILDQTLTANAAGWMEKVITERLMTRSGTGNATHVYTMFGEGGDFIGSAKAKGLGIIGDVYIAISADQIVAEESARHPDWADQVPAVTSFKERVEKNRVLLTQSDLLVCPSRFVHDDLVAHGVDATRLIVAPYGVSTKWVLLDASPEPGRILFAGSANIRKGIHLLAAAAKLLEGRCEIRVAGSVSEKVRKHPGASALTFLGHLGPDEIAEEFARADVFAFPSLAEGSAGVTGEALGAGIPVVTTVEAGSIVRDGIDGHIVPSRDPQCLAEGIISIVRDREKREKMSRAARLRAKECNWDLFAQIVIDAVSGHQRSPGGID